MERFTERTITTNASRLEADDVVIGTVFKNWQGWCWCRWIGEHANPAGISPTREAAVSALLGRQP